MKRYSFFGKKYDINGARIKRYPRLTRYARDENFVGFDAPAYGDLSVFIPDGRLRWDVREKVYCWQGKFVRYLDEWRAEQEIRGHDTFFHDMATKRSSRYLAKIAAIAYCAIRNNKKKLDARYGVAENQRTYRGAIRAYVLEKHGYKCDHCGTKDDLQIDHILPWSKGGKTTVDNARVLCGECNRGVYHLRQKHKKRAA